MNLQSFMNWKGGGILVGIAAALLIYSTDIFKLAYRTAGWEEFGQAPVTVGRVQYFVADTPDIVGYIEPDSGERVSCAETVAYVETEAQETYRCCDTGGRISCLAGNFSSDIPTASEECIGRLKDIFGVPATLSNVREYKVLGSCPSGASRLTVIQIDPRGNILWKSFLYEELGFAASVLRCLLAPLFLALAGWLIVGIVRGQPREPIRRF